MLAKKKVLLVEDNPVNRSLVERRFAKKDIDLTSVEDGLAVFKVLETQSFELILMDMSIPEIDGWEVTRRLKADPKYSDVPIIALTAHSMAGDREKALAAGCDAYVSKPIDFALLFETMEHQLT